MCPAPFARLAWSVADEPELVLNALTEQVMASVCRRDTGHAVFHGCIDWHSCVHGFWALSAAARLTGREALKDFILSRLTDEAIAAEHALLKRRPAFEMPYGRAWFLRLAIEFDRAFADQRLRTMADDVAASLMTYLHMRGADPLASSYESDNWALINLRSFGRHKHSTAIVGFVDDIVRERHLLLDRSCPLDSDARDLSFMAVSTNWAWLVSEVMPRDAFRPWLARFFPESMCLEPVDPGGVSHLYGLNFSRAWGLWRLYRTSGEERFLKLYVNHFDRNYSDPSWWRGDYRKVGHWVPQFGIFALMPVFEADYY